MANKRILVSDKVHQLMIDGLRNNGFSLEYHPMMSYEDVRREARYYNGLIINSKVICDRHFLTQHRHLDFLGRLGSGLDIIDLEAAAEFEIEVINSPEGNANAVAEHTVGMLLSLSHKLCQASHSVKNWQWKRERNRGRELAGRTIGIIGFGHCGSALARKLRDWEMNIITYDKYRQDIETNFPFVKSVNLEQLLAKADIISIHLPLTSDTLGMIDQKFFSMCRQNTILINTSRGAIVDTRALVQALDSGRLMGACIDVLENEKLETVDDSLRQTYQSLMDHDQVILTPHIAGWTFESLEKIASVLLDRILSYYN